MFEHVAPPVSRAFVNARRMLKPGGKLIFTVPFVPDGTHDGALPRPVRVVRSTSATARGRSTNRTRDGEVQTFTDLVFHGGPGRRSRCGCSRARRSTREFRAAGFARVRIAAEPYLPFGIHWPEPWSVPMVAYA